MSDGPKQKRGRPQTLDADKTLDVAMRAYWKSDPADVSLNSISALAGASKPSIYRQFGEEDGLMRAVLDHYAQNVLTDIFHILASALPLPDTLTALTQFAARDPKMETGCVFFKMRAGKHRLGPKTLQGVQEIDAAAVAAFEGYLNNLIESGDWESEQSVPTMARYLFEQIGLAFAQRAAGESPDQVETTLKLALSVFLLRENGHAE